MLRRLVVAAPVSTQGLRAAISVSVLHRAQRPAEWKQSLGSHSRTNIRDPGASLTDIQAFLQSLGHIRQAVSSTDCQAGS